MLVFQYSEKIWRLPAETTESVSEEAHEDMESSEPLDARLIGLGIVLGIVGGFAVDTASIDPSSTTVLIGEKVGERKWFMVILEVVRVDLILEDHDNREMDSFSFRIPVLFDICVLLAR